MEFEDNRFKLKTAGKITNHLRGICGIYPKLIKENQRMSTCNWLDMQTLGYQPVIPKKLPDHCVGSGVRGELEHNRSRSFPSPTC